MSGIDDTEFNYKIGSGSYIPFKLKTKKPQDTYFVVLEPKTPLPSWAINNTAATTGRFPDTYITYVRVSDKDNLDPLQITKRIATEVCQSSRISLSADTNLANTMQEVGCNSLGHAVLQRSLNVGFRKYAMVASQTTVGPNNGERYPLWVVDQALYEAMPRVSNLIKHP